MPDERFAQRQAEISEKKARARASYPALWRAMIAAWQPAGDDRAWLTYAANYLLQTAGVRWALDPYSLFTRLKEANPFDFAADLSALQVVVLSHAHADHLDLNLLAALSGLPLTWVVPKFMLERVETGLCLPRERLVVPQPGKPIRLGALVLTPFAAQHINGLDGVPEMGYLAEFGGKRWLFPGDTRVYNLGGIPRFGRLDGVFAHLWLGKASALEEQPLLLDEFCRFFVGLGAEQIVVANLNELGRDADDLWNMRHYKLAAEKFAALAPAAQVRAARMGESVDL